MIVSTHRYASIGLCGILALILTGCSADGVSVSGKVIFPPSIKLIDSDAAQITLFPEAGSSTARTTGAKIAVDGSFACKDVPPGKYKLVVNVTPYPGSAGQAKRAAQFARLDQTYDEKHTKLTDEIARASQQITVDLVKGTISKE